MRLTLRTLLAYMDDILDPADQENLAKQVEESENATELLHRTRDAMRRLRLGAPPVIGEGMDIDPNAAAEYLDSTMSAEDMSEYQQVCIDSDVHLAEVASCHHILTMVLGEPAEIDPAMREKMYGIPSKLGEWRKLRLDGPHPLATEAAAPVAADSAPAAESTADKPMPKSVVDQHAKPEVPDYLKASDSSRLGRMGLMFAAALLLGFGGFILFGPGGLLMDGNKPIAEGDAENGNPLAGVDLGEAEPGQPSDATAPSSPNTASNGGEDTTPADPTDDPSTTPLPEVTGSEPIGADTPEESPAGDTELPSDPSSNGVMDNGGDDAIVVPPIEPIDVTPIPADDNPADDNPEPGEMAEPADDPGPGDRIAINPNLEIPEDVGPEDVGPVAQPDDETVADGEPAPMGTCVSPKQVLLRWDPNESQWLRLPGRASIIEGDQLMSLPTYRPSLMLLSGLRLELSDGSTATLLFAEDGETPRMEMIYGRFLLQNTSMESLEVELAIGDESKRVALEPRGVLGVEVDRPFVPGADVENSLGTFRAKFYAPLGNVIWNVGGAAIAVTAESQWEWQDKQVSSLTDSVEWLDGQSLDYLERIVSTTFEERLDTKSSARLQLLEFYENSRRREEKSLASLCALQVGQFIPFVQALADTQQQSNWDRQIEQLRRAMSRSTQAAMLVHDTLTEQRGAALADDLFAMLRGYDAKQIGTTPEEVKNGITRQLINWLEHDRLEYRVLAIHNLKDIYGGKTLGYNPVVTEPSRLQRSVRLWRTRLADNELVPEDK